MTTTIHCFLSLSLSFFPPRQRCNHANKQALNNDHFHDDTNSHRRRHQKDTKDVSFFSPMVLFPFSPMVLFPFSSMGDKQRRMSLIPVTQISFDWHLMWISFFPSKQLWCHRQKTLFFQGQNLTRVSLAHLSKEIKDSSFFLLMFPLFLYRPHIMEKNKSGE